MNRPRRSYPSPRTPSLSKGDGEIIVHGVSFRYSDQAGAGAGRGGLDHYIAGSDSWVATADILFYQGNLGAHRHQRPSLFFGHSQSLGQVLIYIGVYRNYGETSRSHIPGK